MKLDDTTLDLEKLFVHPRSDRGTSVPLAILTKLVVAVAIRSLHTDALSLQIRDLAKMTGVPTSGDRLLHSFIEKSLVELGGWLAACAGRKVGGQ